MTICPTCGTVRDLRGAVPSPRGTMEGPATSYPGASVPVITTVRLDTSRTVPGPIELDERDRERHQVAAEGVLQAQCDRRGLVLGAVSHDWRLAGVHHQREGDERPATGAWVLRSSAWCGHRERELS